MQLTQYTPNINNELANPYESALQYILHSNILRETSNTFNLSIVGNASLINYDRSSIYRDISLLHTNNYFYNCYITHHMSNRNAIDDTILSRPKNK
jgi:hypothetical protein